MGRIFGFVLIALAAVSNVASATNFTVDTYVGTSSSPTSSTSYTSGTNVTINVAYNISRICIYSAGGGSAADIGTVTVNHTGVTARSASLQVILMNRPANLSFPTATADLSPVAANWAGISFDSGTADWAILSGSITGNLTGAVDANQIVRIEVGGQVSAAVSAPMSGTAIGWIELGSSTSGGTISAANGDIRVIKATSTSTPMAGAVSAPNGNIVSIIASGGISISGSTGIRAGYGIDSISAGYFDTSQHWKDISATITANYDPSTLTNGELGYLECGNLAGSVRAYNLPTSATVPSGLAVHGNLTAPLRFDNQVAADVVIDGGMSLPGELYIYGPLTASIETGTGSMTKVWIGGDVSAPVDSTIHISSFDAIDELTIIGTVGYADDHDGHEVFLVANPNHDVHGAKLLRGHPRG